MINNKNKYLKYKNKYLNIKGGDNIFSNIHLEYNNEEKTITIFLYKTNNTHSEISQNNVIKYIFVIRVRDKITFHYIYEKVQIMHVDNFEESIDYNTNIQIMKESREILKTFLNNKLADDFAGSVNDILQYINNYNNYIDTIRSEHPEDTSVDLLKLHLTIN